MNPSHTLAEAKQKIEHYCAYQERCHKEVVQKLKQMGMIPAAIDQIMGELIAENYLNELRFAQSFARGKFRIKSWGRNRIKRELKARDISDYCIKSGLAEIDPEDYLSCFHRLAEKKAASLSQLPLAQQKKKLADFLFYRGWESHLVFEKLSELPFETPEN
ncbi:MAG: Regulatory protein RecX [SAR116 cluster bacterium]|nr:MAG: Regulatory protein RecX [SAR116 cluster bacterium]